MSVQVVAELVTTGGLDPLTIARWQFGITTVYHFLMVPLTLGLGAVVVFLQARWVGTGDERWLRMTRFWGKLYLINFIMGVATGLVQEFQFGLAWSEYSRFVGDVFGAPLALEGLFGFFIESTFLGLWIFGWKALPKRLHLTVLILAVAASWASAYFIIVANSWMQHPVGVQLVDGRPTMVDFWAILTNSTALAAWSHALAGAVAVAGGFLLGISWYQLWQRRRDGIDTVDGDGRVQIGEASTVAGRDRTDHHVWLSSLRVGAIVAIIGFTAVAISGDFQAKLMYQQQPMKMAAAEAACHTGTSFSLLTVGNIGTSDCENVVTLIEIPGVLSFLAHGDFTTELPGIKDLIPKYETTYGIELSNDPMFGDRAGSDVHYVPIMWVTYWGFRMMIGFGVIAAFAAVVALWLTRKGTVPRSGWLMRLAVAGILAPFAANSAGWIFTEMGRQPFVVAPNPDLSGVDGVFMFTAAAVSPGVSGLELLISTIALTATYAVLAAVEMFILVRYVRGGVASAMPELGDDADAGSDENGDVLAFAY